MKSLGSELRDLDVPDVSESFIDATFAFARGGGAGVGKTKRGKGGEDHCHCGPPRPAAGRQHARGQPSRGDAGAADLRLLHDRGAAREAHRRPRLRQRQSRRRTGRRGHRDDRAASPQPAQTQDPGRTARCAVTGAAGWWSASTPGSASAAACWCTGSSIPRTSPASFTSPAQPSSSTYFEIGSIIN